MTQFHKFKKICEESCTVVKNVWNVQIFIDKLIYCSQSVFFTEIQILEIVISIG